ncbi:nucleotidyltransferase domain-containing protein [Legionella bononiensis]|uniref:Nucleotidyltransferase domain-containing protein n=1 Tax=Legionella bononiensis TaxID=2793102 RepID=A0ABS1WDL5_9GAMM|nr:nucleotidyltransferase domain-containing protein [Legionella bononiensis]MBL7481407.1 nucleotidyltransferase domain-containing protein [Legionella bononiensis]MBL7527439.1 nucleotidyltransferase domain-containing protein [Legionella bononiensis]
MTKKKKSLNKDTVLQSIVDELTSAYHCHTIILYGSRARGDSTATSDYDVAGITKTGEKQRIARFDETHRVYHDIFVFPESAFDEISDEHLCMSDGVVVIENDSFGTKLLKQLAAAITSPELISPDEIVARKVWYQKMLARASTRDLEGKYRHIWSIFTILEDYFVFKQLRYQGPKKAFKYLEDHDPETLSLFNEVLSNTNDIDILEKLIKKITH